ncbi:RsmE family RNA methyltransferase [Helicobacter trogontum]|uniref:16S rRNA (uracil(1498)-N(3))-methyltransferase n=1 Tax=Helicobacter trogontum TaxID=50960 RepID=A0A4U8T958_9HELI|nr:RsmE family RNA methyltransferase [Helicobacter trogontum]MCI5787037.1 RsmE family RNA methyltransferase [Helicobacter trogontum]MDY5184672.1 RsmE family RNA methyltransferase [Helicobacter trogontum]TLD96124.1 RsmE family RNA methyltransferase [Helicobacter trogontum]
MQFFYHEDSGAESIILDPKDAHYLFHVRRFKQGSTLLTSNLADMQLYNYKHERKNTFKLVALHSKVSQPKAYAHIILAMIDLKDIYDLLPTLNALNVSSLQLFYADFSQKNRKIDMQKAQKIVQYSCMQCGRMQPMEIAVHKDLESVCKAFPNAVVIDFLPAEAIDKSFMDTDIYPNLNGQQIHTIQDNSKELHSKACKHLNLTQFLDPNTYHSGYDKPPKDLDSNQSLSSLEVKDGGNLVQNILKHTRQTFENLTQQERQNISKGGIIIGCEGGFSHNERMFLHSTRKVHPLQTSFILTAHLVSTYIAGLCV